MEGDVFLASHPDDASVASELAARLTESGLLAYFPRPGGPPEHAKLDLAERLVLLIGMAGGEPVAEVAAERFARDPFVRVVGVLLPDAPLDPYSAAATLPLANVVDMGVGHDDPIAYQNLVAVLRGRREPFDVGPIAEPLELARREVSNAVSAFELARSLSGSGFDPDTEVPDALRPRPVETWLLEVRRLYDRSMLERLEVPHVLVGLALLDPGFGHQLSRHDHVDELRAGVGDVEPLLTPFARAILAEQTRP